MTGRKKEIERKRDELALAILRTPPQKRASVSEAKKKRSPKRPGGKFKKGGR